MQHFLTVQVYTTWLHPGLSYVNETFLTSRWQNYEDATKEELGGDKEEDGQGHV